MTSLLWVTEGMSMPLVKMEKSEEGPERFGFKFQVVIWLLMSMHMEI